MYEYILSAYNLSLLALGLLLVGLSVWVIRNRNAREIVGLPGIALVLFCTLVTFGLWANQTVNSPYDNSVTRGGYLACDTFRNYWRAFRARNDGHDDTLDYMMQESCFISEQDFPVSTLDRNWGSAHIIKVRIFTETDVIDVWSHPAILVGYFGQ